MIGPQTRGLFVGDEDQSIYAFTGADVDSVAKLVEEFSCTILPLSVTYRCPRSVVALARSFQGAGNITPRDGAPLGRVTEVDWLDWSPTPGDLVLCRTTRPLVATCWWLLQRGIPAYVEGQSIGAGLVKLAQEISARPDFTWADFQVHADAEFTDRKERILAKNGGDEDDERIDDARDDIESVMMLWSIDRPDTGRGFTATVDRLFAELPKDDNSRVRLATGHRAKGLEAQHVFLLKPGKMPHPMGCRTPGGATQEQNLQYVVVTRAKAEFTFVVGEDPTGGAETDKETGKKVLDVAWDEAVSFMQHENDDEEALAAVIEAVDVALSDEPEGDDDPDGGEEVAADAEEDDTDDDDDDEYDDDMEPIVRSESREIDLGDDEDDFDRADALQQMDDEDALALERRNRDGCGETGHDLDETWTERPPEFQEQRLMVRILVVGTTVYALKVRFPSGHGDLRVEGYANGDSIPTFEGFWGVKGLHSTFIATAQGSHNDLDSRLYNSLNRALRALEG